MAPTPAQLPDDRLPWQDRLVRDAVLAERERCAKVADSEKVDAAETGDPGDEAYNLACTHIAEKIRSGE